MQRTAPHRAGISAVLPIQVDRLMPVLHRHSFSSTVSLVIQFMQKRLHIGCTRAKPPS